MKWLFRIFVGLIIAVAVISVVFVLATRRPDVPYEKLEAQYANDASRFMNMPGDIRIHYRDEGTPDMPVLVLVHGFSASLHTWEPWIERLSPFYRIISLDLPGHGLTRAPKDYDPSPTAYSALLNDFVTALGVEKFVLAGSSMGGHVAWEYALSHQEKLRALVLVSAAGWSEAPGENASEPLIFKLLRLPVVGPILAEIDNRALVERGLKASVADPALVDQAMVDRYVLLSRAPGHRSILMNITLNFGRYQSATKELLQQIRVPVLVMAGEKDNLVPFRNAQQFAAVGGNWSNAFYADLGHLAQEEDPERTAIDVHAFINLVALGELANAQIAPEIPGDGSPDASAMPVAPAPGDDAPVGIAPAAPAPAPAEALPPSPAPILPVTEPPPAPVQRPVTETGPSQGEPAPEPAPSPTP
jgi:pimeloyl-ACP methyl ester carboxylesterase